MRSKVYLAGMLLLAGCATPGASPAPRPATSAADARDPREALPGWMKLPNSDDDSGTVVQAAARRRFGAIDPSRPAGAHSDTATPVGPKATTTEPAAAGPKECCPPEPRKRFPAVGPGGAGVDVSVRTGGENGDEHDEADPRKRHASHGKKRAPGAFSEYHAAEFDLRLVSRVLIMPFANETTYPKAAELVRQAFASELRSTGRFEVIVGSLDLLELPSAKTRAEGWYDEVVLLKLARTYRADAIILGTLSQYHPYAPPVIGLNVQMVVPAEAVVVASVDGIWDANQKLTAERAKRYYRKAVYPHYSSQENELNLDSIRLYTGFVCHQAAQVLVRGVPEEREDTRAAGDAARR